MNKATLKKENTVSILGCGWLGLPLAKHLHTIGYSVKGSVPSTEGFSKLEDTGISAFKIFLNPDINADFDTDFFNSSTLIINFPPKRREDIEEFHPLQFKSLLKQIRNSAVENVIMISSTSVYANNNGIVTEENNNTPEKSSGKALRLVENMLMEEKSFTTTIIRFGGLIGYDRKPGRFLSAKKQVKDGYAPVNLIHQDDCIGVIHFVMKNDLWGEIFNACCPEHPSRKEFYTAAAKKDGFNIPEFSGTKSSFKIISPEKLTKKFKYNFKYTSPIDCL